MDQMPSLSMELRHCSAGHHEGAASSLWRSASSCNELYITSAKYNLLCFALGQAESIACCGHQHQPCLQLIVLTCSPTSSQPNRILSCCSELWLPTHRRAGQQSCCVSRIMQVPITHLQSLCICLPFVSQAVLLAGLHACWADTLQVGVDHIEAGIASILCCSQVSL